MQKNENGSRTRLPNGHRIAVAVTVLLIGGIVGATTYLPFKASGGMATTPSSSWGGLDGSSGIYERADAGITYHKGNNTEVVLGGGSVSLPANQVGYGNSGGTGITSSADLVYVPTVGTLEVQNIAGLTSPDGLNIYDTQTDVDAGSGWNSSIRLNANGVAIIPDRVSGAEFDYTTDRGMTFPPSSAAATAGVGEIRYDTATSKLQFANNGGSWTDFGSGGGSTGNFTFSGNVMDLSASGVMTLGSTNTTAVQLEANAGAAALKFLLDATFGSPYYDLQLTTPSAVLNLFNQSRDGVSLASGQLFDYIGGVAVTSLTATRFQPTSAGGLNLGTDAVPWGNVVGYSYSTRLGAQITAATSITPTTGLHHLTGATSVTTIVATNFSGNGTLTLVCDVTTCNYGTGGNIAVAGTISQNHAARFQYDATSTTWYPQ